MEGDCSINGEGTEGVMTIRHWWNEAGIDACCKLVTCDNHDTLGEMGQNLNDTYTVI